MRCIQYPQSPVFIWLSRRHSFDSALSLGSVSAAAAAAAAASSSSSSGMSILISHLWQCEA